VRRLLILLALTTSLAVAGCGGGGGSGKTSSRPLTKAEYQAQLEQIAKDVAKSLSSASSSTKKLSKAEVDQLVKAVHSFADRIQKVNPPAAVAALHTKLVQTMNDFADQFPDIARQLNEAQDASSAIAVFLGSKPVQELIKLQNAFKAKGYDLNLNG
jgi:hypothetical protein